MFFVAFSYDGEAHGELWTLDLLLMRPGGKYPSTMFTRALLSPAGRRRRRLQTNMEDLGRRWQLLRRGAVSLCASVVVLAVWGSAAAATAYPLEVLPPECKRSTDPQTGAELLFLTTAPENDANLYFHEYSWLADESVILFTSSRAKGGLMGYVTATGELIRFHTPQGALGGATAAVRDNTVIAVRGRSVVEIKLAIQPSNDPAARPSRVGGRSTTKVPRPCWLSR